MDAGIADTINRRDVALVVARLDAIDIDWPADEPWYRTSIATTMLSDIPGARASQAWLFASLITPIPAARFDGEPADGDWDNLFSHFRAEILARRDPETPSCAGSAPVRDGVGSR